MNSILRRVRTSKVKAVVFPQVKVNFPLGDAEYKYTGVVVYTRYDPSDNKWI